MRCETLVCNEKGVMTLFSEVIVPINLIVTNGCKLSPASAPVTEKLEVGLILISGGVRVTNVPAAPPEIDFCRVPSESIS